MPASVTSRPVLKRRSCGLPCSASIAPSPVGEPIRLTSSSCSQKRRLATPASVMPACHVISNARRFGKMAKHLQAAVGQLAAGILAQVQILELRHAGQVQQAIVGELARSAQAEAGDVIQPGDPRQCRIRHQAVGVHAGDAPLLA